MLNGSNAPTGPGRRSGLGAAIAASALVLTVALLGSPLSLAQSKPVAAKGGAARPARISAERGKYLVTICACNDCHTPLKMGKNGPEPDMTKMLSGHPQDLAMPPAKLSDGPWGWVGAMTSTAFAGPWGTSFAVNLTPDPDTGIGSWDEDLFVSTLRGGKIHTGRRPIMPPMPWQSVSKMTDEDLKSVFAYLKSIPPIKNQAPEYIPPAGGSPGGGGQ